MYEANPKSVVVGIDGSEAAINTAKWAIDEAICRGLPLRLVHVIPSAQPHAHLAGSAVGSDWELEKGEAALALAECAVQSAGTPVEVETVLLCGIPEQVLINESHDAALVCVGSARHGWAAEKLLGPTAAALARGAYCPVAIIRTSPGEPPSEHGVIAVVLNDQRDNDEVLHHAMEEGRRRNSTVRLIDRRINSWIRRYPDVPVEMVAAGTGARTAAKHSHLVDLAVVGKADADEIAELATPNCHPILGYPDCSVLLIRH